MKRLVRILFVVGVLFLVYWLVARPTGPEVEPGTTLVLDLSGGYVESTESPLFSRFLFDDGRRPFARLLSELKKAARDERIDAVLLRVRPLQIGWSKAYELRRTIRHVADSGKRTVAYVEVATFSANLEFFVASAADEVFIAPASSAPLIGLAAEYLFLGGLWEKLGVDLEVERIGRYKTAADTFAGREMTDAHRVMANSLLDSIDEQFVGGIAEGRELTPEFVRDLIDQAPVEPEQMAAIGLADGVKHYDEVVEHLGGKPVVKGSAYANVGLSEVGFDPVAHFALVYGSGNVVQGRGRQTPGGGTVLASETVSQALLDASEDEEISAIIFRIDSPGGSALASDVVWRATQRARESGKPVIASFSDVAASGGYYVACGADAIVASPTSITGSIGVVALRPVLRGLYEKLGIGTESLTRGAHADLVLSSQPLSPRAARR